MGRYKAGQCVWVSPSVSGLYVVEDEAVVMDDLGDGYIVLQEVERLPSYGCGHFVQDREVLDLIAA